MSGMWLLLIGLLPDAALAGSGPWTLGQDDRSAYVGADYTRWSKLIADDGALFGKEATELGASITRTDFRVVASYGILRNAEMEVAAGWAWSAVGRQDIGTCTDLGSGACQDVAGLAPVGFKLKVRTLDELNASPLTVSFGPTFRFADHTRPDRGRLTAIGDGQTDVGGFVSAGRSGGLGAMGSYGAYAELAYRHRLALSFVDGLKVPADQYEMITEMLVYTSNPVAVGLTLDVLHRPGGLDLSQVDLTDADRFTVLSVTSAKVGGKLILRSIDNISFVASALGTVYARNNPVDTLTIGVGVGTYRASPHRAVAPP